MLPSPFAGPQPEARLPRQDIEVLRLVYERAVRDMMASPSPVAFPNRLTRRLPCDLR